MSADPVPVSVMILDKEYKVSCTAEEKPALLAAAEHVDQKMRELRTRGSAVGTDRVAVVAALNIAHELLQLQSRQNVIESIDQQIGQLEMAVERVLPPQ